MGGAFVHRLAAPCAALLAACGGGEDPVTETVVRIDAQPCVRAASERVRVLVLDDEGSVALDQQEDLADLTFPLQVPVVPRGGDAARRFWVDAELIAGDGSPVGGVRVAGSYLAGRIAEIPACVTEACAGVDCGDCLPPSCMSCTAAACTLAEGTPVPLGTAPMPCPAIASTCADGGVPDAGAFDAGCAGPEICDDARDDDCDGLTDCFDDECGSDPYCAQRQCVMGSPQFRWCSGACVDTTLADNCGGCGQVCTRTTCRTDVGDGRPRCGCATPDDCPSSANCNTLYGACGCNSGQCGPNASCTPGDGFPAYCRFRVD